MNVRRTWWRLAAGLLVATAVLGAWSFVARAQLPDKFDNLKVLPRDISKEDLHMTMRAFSNGLGVRCDFCHTEAKNAPAGEHRMDWASDAKEEKRIARDMIRMVDAINSQYLGKMNPKPDLSVGCVTCHHGIPHPQTLSSLLQKATADSGATVAVSKYRQLRDRYYGSAAYDFSEGSLNTVAQTMLDQNKPADALTFLNLNAEFYANSMWLTGLMGDAFAASGDKAKAREAYQKVLAAQPNNRMVQRKLDALGAK